MVAIIDYGLGNLASISNMLKKIGVSSIITKNLSEIQNATHLILSGVGHFSKAMDNLINSGLLDVINYEVMIQKKPILGICLGMQLLTEFSEEGNCNGLGWINATTKKFSFDDKHLKIPHMGWEPVNYRKSILSEDKEKERRYYFVHSYFVQCRNREDVLATCEYGIEFDCAIQRNNIIGVQFHPEKSHKFGMEFLSFYIKNFNK